MNTFKLPDKVYDFIKKLTTIVFPAVTVLYGTLAGIFGWGNTVEVIGTIGAVSIFLGAVLGISNVPFQKAGGGVVGDLQVVSIPDDKGGSTKTTLVSFNEDPGTLVDGQRIALQFREKPVDISDL